MQKNFGNGRCMRYLLGVLLLVVSFAPNICKAEDVWVDHWQSENVDIYVMVETLESGYFSNGRYFNVSTKEVRNGELIKVIEWSFSQINSDFWRYETSTMKGSHTTVVIPENRLFEFCMERLGWDYRIKERWYY